MTPEDVGPPNSSVRRCGVNKAKYSAAAGNVTKLKLCISIRPKARVPSFESLAVVLACHLAGSGGRGGRELGSEGTPPGARAGLPAGLRIVGVTKRINCLFVGEFASLRNIRPNRGMSPSTGILFVAPDEFKGVNPLNMSV